MEYTNLHSQQHHEDHLVAGSSIVIPSPSSLAFPSLSVEDDHHEHAWRPGAPTFFLNSNKNNNNIHAINSGEASPNSFNNSMIQDLRFSLPTNNCNNINIHPIISHHENQYLISNKLIKEESSTSSDQSDTSSFQTFSDMLSPSTNTPNEMLLLNTLSPTYKINHMLQPSPFQPNMQFQDNNNNSINSNVVPSLLGGLSTGVTTFSQIFPSVNISKLSSSSMDSSNFRGGLDLFATTARFLEGGSLNQPSPSNHPLELFKGSSRFGYDDGLYSGQSNDRLKLCNSRSNKDLPSFNNNGVVLEPKRPSCIVEPKSTHQVSSKKQRFEARASCPPLKVRKEKLGDRIAALQQLVAPFGKTDTASVLMEAIGYIKFLQNQVETLSVPYMKQGLRNESSNNIQRISEENSENAEEQKQGLRSRGLCLVPLTCITYITSDCGINGAVWPQHHNFNSSF